MERSILEVEHLNVNLGGKPILQDISFTIKEGECLAITGPTGSGKTTLIKALAGQIFSSGKIQFAGKEHPRLTVISRQHQFTNLSNLSSFYYQQRFNSFDAEDAKTAAHELAATGASDSAINEVLERFGVAHIIHSPLIQLSNGEHKRFQIAKAILLHSDWLLLDNPYTGLDVSARKMLNSSLDNLVQHGTHILLVTGPSDIPSMVSHVGILKDGKLEDMLTPAAFRNRHAHFKPESSLDKTALDKIEPAYTYPDFNVAVKMVNTNIIYNNRKILDNINWEVKKGEHWNLAGHNGSGKSTLLSLINGDNPQAFANEIYLFDRRKGTGESIWDIKRKTGFVSPELHHYFESGTNCFDLVASGLFDTMGLFRKLNAVQEKITGQWMELLDVKRFSTRLFSTLSDGEQRRVLLTRALVKNPPLLLLDEPCQGLDETATLQFTALINEICLHMSKTLIYVSHYEAELPSCITSRLILEQGKMRMT
ncbi:MAG TPA: ATP-binding cassette domain-containing protein [Chitinophagaceae bacterium]|nr:ATP-binding cassette domain-containing protein [Chitinophagaceae bacterium]